MSLIFADVSGCFSRESTPALVCGSPLEVTDVFNRRREGRPKTGRRGY